MRKIYDYYATTVGGLEEVVTQDIRKHLHPLEKLRIERGQRHSRVFFRYERSPQRLLELRSVDNIFALLAQFQGITTGKPGLQKIVARISQIDLKPAMALHDTLHGKKPEPVFKLICTVSGNHRFSASDLYHAVRTALSGQYRIGNDPSSATYTLHLQVFGKNALWGLQLAQRRLRNRAYRRITVLGGLESTVAYCMAMLADMSADDICLDPMCGGATTLIEGGMAFQPRLLLGGDLSSHVFAAARENEKAAGLRLNLVRWNAGKLPLNDASVDVILCNLPFEKKVSLSRERSENSVFQEMARVIRPYKNAVILTDYDPFASKDQQIPFEVQKRMKLHLRGVEPFLFVLKRKPD